ncbi:hypothetical protein [Nonomuraea lactucae]|uniref:hypothetical protein n=1 Tax=Nonomuraea lactucae TaxID=2249762 RepID=UPI000DE448E4|nr:hypothetical protein [Nonomuraea lactucae]
MGGTQMDQWDPSDLSIDLTVETMKAAFWGASVTPDFSQAAPAYGSAPWNSGESSGAGYTAGGILILNTTLALVSGQLRWDADNLQITSSTIIAHGYISYVPSISNRIFHATWFGAEFETQDGTFLVTHDPVGLAALDYTP